MRAAAAVRTLAAVATRMPKKPASPEQTAPASSDTPISAELSARPALAQASRTATDHDEDRQDAVLAAQEGHGAVADVAGDLRHLVGAGVLLVDPGAADEGEQQGEGAAHGHRVQKVLLPSLYKLLGG